MIKLEPHICIYGRSRGFTTVFGSHLNDSADFGTTWEDYIDGKYVLLNEEQVDFYKKNPSASPQEVWNMERDPIASPSMISKLIEAINTYDTSSGVNTFYVNGEAAWFSKETRVALNNSIKIEEESGKKETTLWINNTPYTVTIDTAKQLLIDLEFYTIECYNNTQRNIAEAKTLTLEKEVSSFDIKKGYPEKLNFNL